MNRHTHVFFVPANEGFTDSTRALALAEEVEKRLALFETVDVVATPDERDVVSTTAKAIHSGLRHRTAKPEVLRVPIGDFGPPSMDDQRVLQILCEVSRADLSGNILVVVTREQYARVMPRIFIQKFLLGDSTSADMHLTPGCAVLVNCEKKTRCVISPPSVGEVINRHRPDPWRDVFRP